jgi:hypothetical protein
VLGRFHEYARAAILNSRGWRTKRRIVVFESDDWGNIGLTSKSSLDKLRKGGVPVDASPYNLVDSLELSTDLEALAQVLSRYRDFRGRSPVITCFFIMANPDFDAIRSSDFRNYYFECLSTSYKHYSSEGVQDILRSCIQDGLLHPQFHAREHVNVSLWLRDLQQHRTDTLQCFDHRFFGQQRAKLPPRFYSATYWANGIEEFQTVRQSLVNGLDLFESFFGFRSRTFVACNYVLPREVERHASLFGVKGVQTQRGYFAPNDFGLHPKNEYRYTGFINEFKQVFAVRNVEFEPFVKNGKDWLASAMSQIMIAFAMNRPAIITIHRANFSSRLDVSNRDTSLKLLETLLQQILQTWPRAEFMTSPDLLDLMSVK